jgi:hypothetical protein
VRVELGLVRVLGQLVSLLPLFSFFFFSNLVLNFQFKF